MQMNWYNPVNGGSTSPAGVRANDGHAMNGNAVMYDAVAGKIFTCGGAPSYQVGPGSMRGFMVSVRW